MALHISPYPYRANGQMFRHFSNVEAFAKPLGTQKNKQRHQEAKWLNLCKKRINDCLAVSQSGWAVWTFHPFARSAADYLRFAI